MSYTQTAFAKINLALHVRTRRDDGYHELETLFAFVDVGDRLTAQEVAQDSLEIVGPFSGELDAGLGNIVSEALSALPHPRGLAIALEKNLPVAAGLGGGSADAGAVFRMFHEVFGLPADWKERAAKLGADVPACVESVACIGRGIGTQLERVSNDLARKPVLLVNPRVAMPTGPVFAAWDAVDRGAMPDGPCSQILREGRNDLEAPAIAMAPVIRDVLDALAGHGSFAARMSGSGATCFALFDDDAARDAAARDIAADYPDWWQMAGKLR